MEAVTRSASRFFSGTAISRATGFGRDLITAAAFGAHPALAALMIAFRFANLPRRLLGEGAMHSAFVPAYERAESPEKASALFRDLSASLILFILVLLIFVETGLRYWLKADPTPETTQVIRLTMRLLPALAFISLFGINQAYLNCQNRYFLPSVAPALFNLTWIIAAYLLFNRPANEAIPILGGAILLAYFLQWLFTLPAVLPALQAGPFRPFSKPVRRLLKPLLLAMLGVAAIQINSALDPLFARHADPSGPAYLWYAIRLQQLPLALFGVALYNALLPPLSRAVKSGDAPLARALLRHATKRTLLLMLPATLAIFALGGLAVQLIYGHGHFTPLDGAHTTRCLWAYGVGLLPATLVLLRTATFYARDDYRTPAIASALAVATNIGLNTLFIFGLHWGCASVALATSLASLVQLLYLRLHKLV
jgi:putative peptidoglycan lipid II flippase